MQVYTPKGQSSPGILQSGQLASKGIRQIPQLSSFAIHLQVATPVQPVIDYMYSSTFLDSSNLKLTTPLTNVIVLGKVLCGNSGVVTSCTEVIICKKVTFCSVRIFA